MKTQKATINDISKASSNASANKDYKRRRHLEMKKRIGILHYRRDRLEHELDAIKSALFNLNKQIQQDREFEQLTICD